MASATRTITVKVFRFNALRDESPRYDVYEMAYEEGQTILGVLKNIYENQDSSLAFYHSCRIGKCTGCHVKVNGKVRLACTTLVDEESLVLEPMPGYEVVRDLVVNRTQASVSRSPRKQKTSPGSPK